MCGSAHKRSQQPPTGSGIKLTEAAYKVTPEDLGRLRRVGFDDVAILQITLIAAWFNYINRVADVLGVGRPDPDIAGQFAV
jgi:hypothetical protein